MVNLTKNFIDECLNGKDCVNCKDCQADKQSWTNLECIMADDGKNFIEHLQKYFLVQRKRRIFQQEQKGLDLTLSEAEELFILSRY